MIKARFAWNYLNRIFFSVNRYCKHINLIVECKSRYIPKRFKYPVIAVFTSKFINSYNRYSFVIIPYYFFIICGYSDGSKAYFYSGQRTGKN
jgi:hypothetical protein